MLKRLVALLICVVLVAMALPIGASAASQEEQQRICDQIRRIYRKTNYSIEGDMRGYCGEMAGWEFYYLGVTDIPLRYNGNEMYDIFSTTSHINEGYRVDCYPASRYTIEEALNTITACGQKDAYNILAGYHWTTTAAGSLYGHVTVIHAVLDGMVYFTESFITPFQIDPSQPMICSIADFADYYDSWTSFEGMIHFGKGNFVDGCTVYGSDLYVAVTEPAELLTSADPEKANVSRTASAGERLHATAVCQTDDGKLYYQISEQNQQLYVAAELAEPCWFVYEDVQTNGVKLPQKLSVGKDFQLSGMIRSTSSRIHNTVIQVTDPEGTAVLTFEIPKDSYMLDLSSGSVNDTVNLSDLAEGNYICSVYCDLGNSYCQDGQVIGKIQRTLVAESAFAVGNAAPLENGEETGIETQSIPADGWSLENGAWYYRENGQYRIGWFCDNGVTYYLQADGSAATGWQTINGKSRYFTETGAMRTGWLHDGENTYYMLSNGVPATGDTTIDGIVYEFSNDGLFLRAKGSTFAQLKNK